MPRYAVYAEQWVKQVAEIEVDAVSEEDAMQQANEETDWDWRDYEEDDYDNKFEVTGVDELADEDEDDEEAVEDDLAEGEKNAEV